MTLNQTIQESLVPLTGKLSNTDIVVTSLCAGAIAGALAKTTIAPLDRTKINFQISEKPYSTKKALKFLIQTLKNHGFFALWRGNSATMARIVPYAAIQFTAHEQWKRLLNVDASGKSPGKQFLAGSLAGVTSQSLTYPLDLARARMAVTPKDQYATLRQVFLKIYRQEGLLTFYRGIIPTLLGVIPYAGVSFYTYETLKRQYKEHIGHLNIPQPITSLGFGAIAGMLGQTSSYPLDIVRRRMQTDMINKYPSISGTLKLIWFNEGLKNGLYKGLSMNWIKGPIAVGISFATYDNIRDTLRTVVLKYR
ncbi:mitochondrial coenzyme A transporter SLC25A42 [Onthophagus taurus]|uniref:mitochondrial coenzyme A transporter SLC25A42 n=1 Tax=Onthophagus taurus TaxID=166361 RepID=UPI000C20F20B|nr:mitochondrial coenzyme A transporter SLC25A42 [Onthophagus taurus]